MCLLTYLLEYGGHLARSVFIVVVHSWVSFVFLYGYKNGLGGPSDAGAPLLNSAVKPYRVEEQLLTTTRILLYADSINPRKNAFFLAIKIP